MAENFHAKLRFKKNIYLFRGPINPFFSWWLGPSCRNLALFEGFWMKPPMEAWKKRWPCDRLDWNNPLKNQMFSDKLTSKLQLNSQYSLGVKELLWWSDFRNNTTYNTQPAGLIGQPFRSSCLCLQNGAAFIHLFYLNFLTFDLPISFAMSFWSPMLRHTQLRNEKKTSLSL